jgi:hypothetical protein
MAHLITSPEKFADEVNAKLLGAHRQITVGDVRDMTTCGLIGKYGYYMHIDIETVRAILQYEQLRLNRQKRDEIRDKNGAIHCRRCGVVLAKPEGKKGRPREYCPDCESSRPTMRSREWRGKMKKITTLHADPEEKALLAISKS